MAKLSSKDRRNLPPGAFALPDKKAYPIIDRGHAISAKSMAGREYKAGRLSAEDYKKITTKADQFLNRRP